MPDGDRTDGARIPEEHQSAGYEAQIPEERQSAGRETQTPEERQSAGYEAQTPEEHQSAGCETQIPEEQHSFMRIEEEPEERQSVVSGAATEGSLYTSFAAAEQQAAIEAILFAMGGAVPCDRIAAATDCSPEDIRRILHAMMIRYEKSDRGIRILELDGSYQLCTKKEYYQTLIRIASVPRKIVLTSVLLETLSIIAYKQPVTKIEIEKIRGVKSDHAVNKLVEYDLVMEVGRLDAPGRPIVFGTTEEFLRHFGISSLDELPGIDPLQVEDFRLEAEEEARLKLNV